MFHKSHFPPASTVYVYLKTGSDICIKSDSIETDDGVVLAQTVHGSRVAIPAANVDYMVAVDLTL